MESSHTTSLRLGAKLVIFLLLSHQLSAQTIPAGMSDMDDALRQLQLQGKLNSRYSLMARPFFADERITIDSLYALIDSSHSPRVIRTRLFKGNGVMELLPLSISNQFNSHHPYGWNQPGFIPAKGFQTKVSAGIFTAIGPLSIQFKPEYVYAANPDFDHSNDFGAASRGTYQRLLPGQSSVRLNIGALSLGVSSENLWWGPGIFNSLLMSSNAPGFWHVTFNTRRPLKTAVGNFEWQLIAGKLTEDTSVLLENKNLTTTYYNPFTYGGEGYAGPYDPKQKWRYLNGLTLTYNPKWVKGLFIGFSRVGYAYNDNIASSNLDFFHKYLPTIFGAFRQDYAYGNDTVGHSIRYKQIASFHIRFLFPRSHTECYAEYGLHDNAYNLRDFALDPQHALAYTVGFKKLMPLQRQRWLDLTAELTKLSQPTDYLVRTAGYWYAYQGGYTNQSRIIGAGFGMGSNMQTLQLTHIAGFNQWGLTLQCIQHDPVPANAGLPLASLGLRAVKWSDLALGIKLQHKWSSFLLNLQLQGVSSANYTWQPANNTFNFYGLANLVYLW
jgi:hypothetical protein